MPPSPARAPRCSECGLTWRRKSGAGQDGRETTKEGVRRKVVKVTVALTARARNNIGVRVCICMCVACICGRVYQCTCIRASVCEYVRVGAPRAEKRTEDLFLVPRTVAAFLTKVLSVGCTSLASVPRNGP